MTTWVCHHPPELPSNRRGFHLWEVKACPRPLAISIDAPTFDNLRKCGPPGLPRRFSQLAVLDARLDIRVRRLDEPA